MVKGKNKAQANDSKKQAMDPGPDMKQKMHLNSYDYMLTERMRKVQICKYRYIVQAER